MVMDEGPKGTIPIYSPRRLDVVALHRLLHVVDEQLRRDAETVEAAHQAVQQHGQAGRGGETSVHHSAVAQHHDEDVEFAPLPVDLHRATLTPVDLRLLTRYGLETLRDLARVIRIQRRHKLPQNRHPTRVASRLQLPPQHRGGQVKSRQARERVYALKGSRLDTRQWGAASNVWRTNWLYTVCRATPHWRAICAFDTPFLAKYLISMITSGTVIDEALCVWEISLWKESVSKLQMYEGFTLRIGRIIPTVDR